jgi:hypothetical protein
VLTLLNQYEIISRGIAIQSQRFCFVLPVHGRGRFWRRNMAGNIGFGGGRQ